MGNSQCLKYLRKVPESRRVMLNLQGTKLFIVTSAPKEGVVRFSVFFKLHRVIQPLIQQCFMSKMVYLNVKYLIATRNYELFLYNRPQQNLMGNITLSSVIISVASVN